MINLVRILWLAAILACIWLPSVAPAQSLSDLATSPNPQALRAFALVQNRPFDRRPLVISIDMSSAKERGTFDLTFRGWSEAREIAGGWIERRDWIETMSANASFHGESGSVEYRWPTFLLSLIVYDQRGHKRDVHDLSADAPSPTVSSTGSAEAQDGLKSMSGEMLQRAATWLEGLVVNYGDHQILVGTTFLPLTIDEYLDWGSKEIIGPDLRGKTGSDPTSDQIKRILALVKMKTWENQVRVRGMSLIGAEEVIDYSGRLAYKSEINGRQADFDSDNRYLIDPYTGMIRRSGQTGTVTFEFDGNSLALDTVLTTDSPAADSAGRSSSSQSAAATPPPISNGGDDPEQDAPSPNVQQGSGSGPTSASEMSIADIYDKALPAIVFIEAGNATGSGFLISGTDIITNNHVVVGNSAVRVLLTDGRTFTAKVLKLDKSADLALLRLSRPAGVRPLRLARTVPRVGEQVLIIGAPEGLRGTLTGGLVSGLRDRNGVALVQTDAAMNHGNSGGPVLDRRGDVVGVVSFGLADTEALGFGIAAAEVQRRLLVP